MSETDLVLDAVMPVVEARADQELLEETEAGADIRVDERRIDVVGPKKQHGDVQGEGRPLERAPEPDQRS